MPVTTRVKSTITFATKSLFLSVPKWHSGKIWQQPSLVIHNAVILMLALGKEVTLSSNDLVRIFDAYDVMSPLRGGDQVLHGVKIELQGTSVI